MKKAKLLTCLSMPIFCATLTGCLGGGGGGSSVNKDKKQIYVGLYNGGWGEDWFNEATTLFQEKYPEYEVIAVPKKDDYLYQNLSGTINTKADVNDMYIAACPMYSYMEKNELLDITDAVTSDLADLGEPGKSVESKIDDEHKDFYKTSDGKYYAVPFGSSIWGITYDVDLFEEESLFINSYNSTSNRITWTDGKDGSLPKSAGKDGVSGTWDDGTPVTFKEFKLLLNKMKTKSITPFLWADQSGYVNYNLLSCWADAQGYDSFLSALSLNGEFEGWDGNFYQMTPQTGYNIGMMKGKKAALEFAKEIASNENNYSPKSGTVNETYMVAQNDFILSKYSATRDPVAQRIAFLIEGGHWYNEAKSKIEDSNTKYYSTDYPNGRRFSILPFPTFEGINEGSNQHTFVESSHQFSMFINRESKEPEGAKKFIRFMCSDPILKLTTGMSGLHRNYKYDMTDEELASLPYFYQQIFKLQNSPNVKIVGFRMPKGFYTANSGMAELYWVFEGSFTTNKDQTKNLGTPLYDFANYTSLGLTVEKYLEGSKEARKPTFEAYTGN